MWNIQISYKTIDLQCKNLQNERFLIFHPGSPALNTAVALVDDIARRSQRCQPGTDHRHRDVIKMEEKQFGVSGRADLFSRWERATNAWWFRHRGRILRSGGRISITPRLIIKQKPRRLIRKRRQGRLFKVTKAAQTSAPPTEIRRVVSARQDAKHAVRGKVGKAGGPEDTWRISDPPENHVKGERRGHGSVAASSVRRGSGQESSGF